MAVLTATLPNFIGETVTARNLDPIIVGGAVYAPKDITATIGGAGTLSLTLITPASGAARYAVTLPAETGRQRPRVLIAVEADDTDLATLIAAGLEEYEAGDVQTLLSLYATLAAFTAHTADAANPHAVTAAQVGLARHVTAQTLTDAASIAWDTSAGHMASVTLGGNRTLAAPTNGVAGTYILRVTQDGTGSRTLAYDAVFEWAGGTAPVLSTAAGAVDVLSFVSFDGAAFQGSLIKNFT